MKPTYEVALLAASLWACASSSARHSCPACPGGAAQPQTALPTSMAVVPYCHISTDSVLVHTIMTTTVSRASNGTTEPPYRTVLYLKCMKGPRLTFVTGMQRSPPPSTT